MTSYSIVSSFPDVASLMALKARGITEIVIHTDVFDSDRLAAITHVGSLTLKAEGGDIRIYRLR